jgi:hypothetical protein
MFLAVARLRSFSGAARELGEQDPILDREGGQRE